MKARKLIVVCFAIVAVFSWTGAASGALMHYWDFEDADGTLGDVLADTANLYIGNAGAGAKDLTASTAYTVAAGYGTPKAVSGNNYGYQGFPTADLTDLGESFTYEVWVRRDGPGYRGWDRMTQQGGPCYIQSGNNTFSVSDPGGSASAVVGYVDVYGGTWYHMAVVADNTAGTIDAYLTPVGGAAPVLVATGAYAYTGTPAGVAFGVSDTYKYNADAAYDDAAIWNTALDTATLTDHYLNGLGLVLIPEPATMGLLALGGLGLLLRRKRR